MAELYAVDVRTVNEHSKNIYDSGELQRETTIRKFRARAKLRAEAFAELGRIVVDEAMGALPLRRWHGFRLLAVDGSVFLLPKAPAIVAAFEQTGEVTPQGRFSRLYDVLDGLIVAADIEPQRVGERVLAGEYLPATLADDLLLYDRGYPAFWLFAAHAVEQRHFCARLPRTFCAEVAAFAAGQARSAVITLTPGEEARRQCQAFGLPTEALRLRLIRVRLKGGEEEFLITSLLDEETFPAPLFKRLYHLLRQCAVEDEGQRRAPARLGPAAGTP